MARNMTFNPTRLKTGDECCFFLTSDNTNKVSEGLHNSVGDGLRLVFGVVVEKKEFLKGHSDSLWGTRSFSFRVRLSQPTVGNIKEVTFNEEGIVFASLKDAIAYLDMRVEGFVQTNKEHKERFKKNKGIIHIVK
jgi:hypothetical protein